MRHSDTTKLITAFFLGLVVALSSAYVAMRQKQAPAAPYSSNPEVVSARLPASAPKVAESVSKDIAAVPVSKASDSMPTEHPAAAKPRRKTPAKQEPKQEPVLIASAQAPAPAQPTTNVSVVPASAPSAPESKPAADSSPVFHPETAPVSTPAPTPQAHVVTLQPGTVLSVRLNQTLSTEKNYPGDTFRATLTAPLIVDGFIIADRGSRVQGQVVEADRSGRVKGRANMELALTEINTTDGQRVRIQTNTFTRCAWRLNRRFGGWGQRRGHWCGCRGCGGNGFSARYARQGSSAAERDRADVPAHEPGDDHRTNSQLARYHWLMTLPSERRTTPQPPSRRLRGSGSVPNGYLAAAFMLISTPHPGFSFASA